MKQNKRDERQYFHIHFKNKDKDEHSSELKKKNVPEDFRESFSR